MGAEWAPLNKAQEVQFEVMERALGGKNVDELVTFSYHPETSKENLEVFR